MTTSKTYIDATSGVLIQHHVLPLHARTSMRHHCVRYALSGAGCCECYSILHLPALTSMHAPPTLRSAAPRHCDRVIDEPGVGAVRRDMLRASTARAHARGVSARTPIWGYRWMKIFASCRSLHASLLPLRLGMTSRCSLTRRRARMAYTLSLAFSSRRHRLVISPYPSLPADTSSTRSPPRLATYHRAFTTTTPHAFATRCAGTRPAVIARLPTYPYPACLNVAGCASGWNNMWTRRGGVEVGMATARTRVSARVFRMNIHITGHLIFRYSRPCACRGATYLGEIVCAVALQTYTCLRFRCDFCHQVTTRLASPHQRTYAHFSTPANVTGCATTVYALLPRGHSVRAPAVAIDVNRSDGVEEGWRRRQTGHNIITVVADVNATTHMVDGDGTCGVYARRGIHTAATAAVIMTAC